MMAYCPPKIVAFAIVASAIIIPWQRERVNRLRQNFQKNFGGNIIKEIWENTKGQKAACDLASLHGNVREAQEKVLSLSQKVAKTFETFCVCS